MLHASYSILKSQEYNIHGANYANPSMISKTASPYSISQTVTFSQICFIFVPQEEATQGHNRPPNTTEDISLNPAQYKANNDNGRIKNRKQEKKKP
jgi:hypothetical protein